MKPKRVALAGILLLAASAARDVRAETRQLSWDAVTTYSDGTPLEPGKTVSYTAYWSNDPWLSTETLRTLASSSPSTSASFDPAVQGMTGYRTVYFTVKSVLSTGEVSILSAALPWSPPLPTAVAPDSPQPLQGGRAPSSPTGGTYIVSWNPVSTYTDGSPIAGKTVMYMLYWTTDVKLSPASLASIATMTLNPYVSFDPAAEGMQAGERAYFTAKTVLGSGEESALSESLSWQVLNKGPGAPGNGRITRKNRK